MKNKVERMAWTNMKHRCLNPKHKQFKDYGGRGITVCKEWLESFDAFLDDVGPKPSPDLTLDRINNNGNYEPGNVAWRSRSLQQRNRRKLASKNHRLITYKGRTQTLQAWSDELNIKRSTLQVRLDDGWDAQRAFETPVRIYIKVNRN